MSEPGFYRVGCVLLYMYDIMKACLALPLLHVCLGLEG